MTELLLSGIERCCCHRYCAYVVWNIVTSVEISLPLLIVVVVVGMASPTMPAKIVNFAEFIKLEAKRYFLIKNERIRDDDI